MVSCGLYIRVSSEEQKINGYSLGEQEERLRKYCEAMGWEVYKIYNDGGFSGANTNRPALQELIRDIKKIDKVVVYKLDRLSRSQKDTLYLIEDIILGNGCDFVSMTENFDTSTPLGRAMIGIISVFAQLEREQIKERMMMGKTARAKKGLYGGGRLFPIGYDYVDGQLIVNDYEASIIQKIYTDYANGISPIQISKELNNKGLYHKYGKWNDATVRKALTYKTYLGYISWGGELHKGIHEPIITKELFDRVQARRQRSKETRHDRAGKFNSYLGGLLVCGECGERYQKQSGRSHEKYYYEYYGCVSRYRKSRGHGAKCTNKSWKMYDLDNLIIEEIRKLSFEEVKPQRKKPIDTKIDKKIAEIEKQMSKLLDLYTTGGIPADILQDKIKALNEQKSKLEKEFSAPGPKMSKAEAKSLSAALDDILESGDLEQIHGIISELIDKIEINGDDITIFWAFS